MAHSKTTQARTLVAHTIAEPMPKSTSDTMRAGIKAMMTPYMLRSTESVPWAWGESETISFPIFFFLETLIICFCSVELSLVIYNKVATACHHQGEHYLALRARMMPITVCLPKRMLSRMGRCDGQVN